MHGDRMRRGRWVLVAATAVVVLGAVYLGASAYAWASLTAVDGQMCSAEHAKQTPATFTAVWGGKEFLDATPYRFGDAVDVELSSRTPGLTLRGWWAPPVAPETRAVIVVHGRESCHRDPAVLLPAAMVHRQGFGVLMVDLRDHGDSDREDGHWAGGADEWQDVLGAWDWLRAKGYPPEAIGALGLSMGAGAVTMAMGNEQGLLAAFLDSPYANIVEMSADVAAKTNRPAFLVPGALLMGQLISGDDFLGDSPERAFEQRLNGRAVDIVHGTADGTIPVEQGLRLAEAAGRGGTAVDPWILDGVEHVQAAFIEPEEYERRVTDFFRDHLVPTAP